MPRRFQDRRKFDSRPERAVIYIYSEGTVTEPNYFTAIKRELRLAQVDIRPIGTSRSTLSLVDFVIAEKGINSQDEFWVVFDRDDHTDFNKAIEKGEANGLGVAYSNECFELWFILHFEYLSSALGRENFAVKLTKLLTEKYAKNMDVYSRIKDKESAAIRNAKKLEEMHSKAGTTSLQGRTPSTTVYKLVEHLRAKAE